MDNPQRIKEYKNFILYRWRKSSHTQILYILENVVEGNTDSTFDDLAEKIKTAYKERTVKSKVEIYTGEKNRIEIIRKGIFPSIIICKNE